MTHDGRWTEFVPTGTGGIMIVTGKVGQGPDFKINLPPFVLPALRDYFSNERTLP